MDEDLKELRKETERKLLQQIGKSVDADKPNDAQGWCNAYLMFTNALPEEVEE